MYICEWYRNSGDCYINIPDSVYKCECMGDRNLCTKFLFSSERPYETDKKGKEE